jgi:hypothetical protein
MRRYSVNLIKRLKNRNKLKKFKGWKDSGKSIEKWILGGLSSKKKQAKK